MFSVIVPAYNEAAVIDRCLDAMLADAAPGELEIIVVANNCSDDTADRARSKGEAVTVVETPVGSKIHALNLGDAAASGWPRCYVDADIVVSTAALRAVVDLLNGGDVVVAAPQVRVELSDRPWTVRSFYRVWTSLPYFTEGVIGTGFFAFSEAGRSRFGEWPDIIADDEYARLVAAPHERGIVRDHSFTVTPPTTLRNVAHIQIRSRAGAAQVADRFGELQANETTGASRSLAEIARTPRLWPHAPLYLGVMLYAELRARRKLQSDEATVWERDESARVG